MKKGADAKPQKLPEGIKKNNMIQHDLKSSNISLEKKINDQDNLNKQFPMKINISAPSAYVDK